MLIAGRCVTQVAAPQALEFRSEAESAQKHDERVLQEAEKRGVYRLRVAYVKVEGRRGG